MIAESQFLDADAKVEWLLERNLLYDSAVKPEVFSCLQAALPETSKAVRRQVLARARKGKTRAEAPRLRPRTRAYERYNLLVWLNKCVPEDPGFKKAFDAEQAKHSDFGPRDRPDLDFGPIETRVGTVSPITADELLLKNPRDPSTVEWLKSYQADSQNIWGPDREGLLSTLSEAVAAKPQWGTAIGETLGGQEDWNADLWPALLRGWGRVEAPRRLSAKVFEVLEKHQAADRISNDVCQLLADAVSGLSARPSWLGRAMKLARMLWPVVADEGTPLSGPDWLTAAINHPGGKLAQFFLRALSLDGQKDPKAEGSRMPKRYAAAFEEMIVSAGGAAEAARTVLSSQLHFLWARDERWTGRVILPSFDWESDVTRAEQCWHGYLMWARLNERLIEVMLPRYQETFVHVNSQNDEWRDRFTEHLSWIATLSVRDPRKDGWLRQFVATCDSEDRTRWASHVGFRLRELEQPAADHLWNRWIRKYWLERSKGVPRRLSQGESSKMVLWTAAFVDALPEAVDLVLEGHQVKVDTFFYDLIEDSPAVDQHAASMASLLAFVLSAEQQPFFACPDALKLARRLSQQLGARQSTIRSAAKELRRLGCGAP